MEGLYKGDAGVGLVGIGIMNPAKVSYNDQVNPFLFKIEIPNMLSILAERDAKAYVPGIADLIEGGYPLKDGRLALSAQERSPADRKPFRLSPIIAKRSRDKDQETAASFAKNTLEENFSYFGYGYVKNPTELIPSVKLTFYFSISW